MRHAAEFGLIGLVFLACTAVAQSSPAKDMPTPPTLPYYDWKACPFEGCSYGEWTALKTVEVYDTWKTTRHAIKTLKVSEKVKAIAGVVITFKPGVIRVDRDWPTQELKKGDTLLTYTYCGEGFSVVWYRGKFFAEFDISFTKWPDGSGCSGSSCAATYEDLGKKEWWVQVELNSGARGWIRIPLTGTEPLFDGMDALASLHLPVWRVLAPVPHSANS